MGIGADVPFVAHFPSNRRFPQRNRHLPYQGVFCVVALLEAYATATITTETRKSKGNTFNKKTAKALIALSARFLCYQCTTNLSSWSDRLYFGKLS